jgi:hypothetical protein
MFLGYYSLIAAFAAFSYFLLSVRGFTFFPFFLLSAFELYLVACTYHVGMSPASKI